MNRINKLKRIIRDQDIDYFLINSPNNIYYITGFYPTTEAYLLYSRDGGFILYVTDIDYQDSKNREDSFTVDKTPLELTISDYVKSKLENIRGKVHLEYTFLTHFYFNKFFAGNKELEFFSGDKIISDMRQVKDRNELELIYKSISITERGIMTAYNAINEGKTEIELAAEAEYAMRRSGAEGFAFDSLIVSGKRTSWPHAKSTENSLRKGDLVIVDLGCKYKGYCSDMTRTFTVGEADDTQKKIYGLVKKAQELAVEEIRAGVQADTVDLTARNFFREEGYGEYFIHSLGHGVGLDVHEAPSISFRNHDAVKEGNVFTVEPGLYIPGWGGIRIEDMIIVEKRGARLITNLPKMI